MSFIFPEESFLSGSSKIVLNATALNLPISDSDYLYLRAPNEHPIDAYHGAVEQIKAQIALKQNSALEESSTQEETPVETNTVATTSQIVYIAVPQATQEDAPVLTSTSSPSQTASISNVRKELFSPFEIFLFICFALATGIFGYIELRKYRKSISSSISIEEV